MLFGTRAESSILKKHGRPKSVVPHSLNKRTLYILPLLQYKLGGVHDVLTREQGNA
jgi:hypothetical protein